MEEEEAKLYAEIDREIEVQDETLLASGFQPLMSDTDETGTLYEPQNEANTSKNTQRVNNKTKATEETACDVNNTKMQHTEMGSEVNGDI